LFLLIKAHLKNHSAALKRTTQRSTCRHPQHHTGTQSAAGRTTGTAQTPQTHSDTQHLQARKNRHTATHLPHRQAQKALLDTQQSAKQAQG